MIKPISFCINTSVNELDYLKLLFKSLEENLSTLDHEIIVFIDSDNQGTFEWLLEQKSKFTDLKILRNILPVCYGYARNINEMFKFASNDIVSYLQSDMVISKDYDVYLIKNIEQGIVLSSTRIEPPLHGPGPEKHTANFGFTPQEFQYDDFLKYCEDNRREEKTGYFFAPFTLYKEVWNSIGGHDTQFRRSREDSDVLNRLVLNGVKIVQTWEALVYHFTCVSSRGQDWYNPDNKKSQERAQLQSRADMVEMSRMNSKWGTFSHGSPVEYYYKINSEIDIDIDNYSLFKTVSSFFITNYINQPSVKSNYNSIDEHIYANKLLNISDEDWKKYSYMFNIEDTDNRVKVGKAKGDIIIKFKLSDVTQSSYNDILQNLQHIVNQYDEGAYFYNGFTVIIEKKTNIIKSKINCTNPEVIERHRYTIN